MIRKESIVARLCQYKLVYEEIGQELGAIDPDMRGFDDWSWTW